MYRCLEKKERGGVGVFICVVVGVEGGESKSGKKKSDGVEGTDGIYKQYEGDGWDIKERIW